MPRKRPAWIASLISDLPALEVDAGIDDGVHDVADDHHQQAEQREEIERAEHDRIVPVQRGLEAEEDEAVPRKDHLDQQRTADQDGEQGAGEAGDDPQQGDAEYETREPAMNRETLGG